MYTIEYILRLTDGLDGQKMAKKPDLPIMQRGWKELRLFLLKKMEKHLDLPKELICILGLDIALMYKPMDGKDISLME